MKAHLLKSVLGRMLGKTIGKFLLAGVVLGGFLATIGSATASAGPGYYCDRPPVHVVVRGGFYAPRAVYVGPGFYGPRRVVVVRHRFWDARYHCWRYYR